MITEDMIRDSSDKELLDILLQELTARVSVSEGENMEEFLRQLRRLPPGLRAMAAVYQLDISITLDDLGWHFGNWHDKEYYEETLTGLLELEASEEADIFAAAFALTSPYWEKIGQLCASGDFPEWYAGSQLAKDMEPLNRKVWSKTKPPNLGLFEYWTAYARKYPHRLTQMSN